MDRLTPVFERFTPKVQIRFAKRILGRIDTPAAHQSGQIYWLRSGEVTLQADHVLVQTIPGPSVIYLPDPSKCEIRSRSQAEVVCADLEFGQRFDNPLALMDLPMVVVAVSEAADIAVIHELLMQEAFSERCGKMLATQHLFQYFLFVFFRHLIRTRAVPAGIIMALNDERLLRAVTSMHRHPEQVWTLERLADTATMSRATFARKFRETMGKTPLEYLTEWRIKLAKSMIARGIPIKSVARDVGYASSAVLTRVFTQQVGKSPRQWANAPAPDDVRDAA